MRERLARMSGPARRAATVAGSLERAFSVSDLGTMLGLRPASVLAAVEELMEAGIVKGHGDRLSFLHDLTRESVRQACPPSARRALDRQAADVMLARGALPVEVATQLAVSLTRRFFRPLQATRLAGLPAFISRSGLTRGQRWPCESHRKGPSM
jgi:hypothetical protein